MSFDLGLLDTIVILMMENRSFDHMLGYLSLPGYGDGYKSQKTIRGLKDDPAWLNSVANDWKGTLYKPRPVERSQIADPPHERKNIELQMGGPDAEGMFPLNGFADSADEPGVMYYQVPGQIPLLDFFARNYRVCDHWFSCVPASTQPNRLMAMAGYTLIDGNVTILPYHRLVYEWLSDQAVSWRVYHQDLVPFFAMMPRWLPEIAAGDKFRSFKRFAADFLLEPDATFPEVIFVEPIYNDAPGNHGAGTDDHSISSVYGGQKLMHDVYTAMLNSRRWRHSALIITYDEHGGFFDHEQPIPLETAVFDDRYLAFQTSGIRVPGLIVSPFVSAGTVFQGDLDHTSILKLLGDKFGKGSYSREVDRRNVQSLAAAFNRPSPRTDDLDPPDPSPTPPLPATLPTPVAAPSTIRPAFENAVELMKTNYPHELATKFPERLDLFKPKP
ncbi:MAG TPA: alkaline phosphatase family protein [Candidatus Binataceae bacterium]|nr:alkaline phosphatase family protein [Candidatus Binataceae bacterium]